MSHSSIANLRAIPNQKPGAPTLALAAKVKATPVSSAAFAFVL
jgi:hypothetical protein